MTTENYNELSPKQLTTENYNERSPKQLTTENSNELSPKQMTTENYNERSPKQLTTENSNELSPKQLKPESYTESLHATETKDESVWKSFVFRKSLIRISTRNPADEFRNVSHSFQPITVTVQLHPS